MYCLMFSMGSEYSSGSAYLVLTPLHKKMKVSIKDFSKNVNKSAGKSGFGHIYC